MVRQLRFFVVFGLTLGWVVTDEFDVRVDDGRLIRLSTFDLSKPNAQCQFQPQAKLESSAGDAMNPAHRKFVRGNAGELDDGSGASKTFRSSRTFDTVCRC